MMVNQLSSESGESPSFLNHTYYKEENSVFILPLAVYIATFCVGCVINGVLIIVVLIKNTIPRQRHQKLHSVLIAHLAFVAVCLAFGILVNTSTIFFMLPVKPFLCQPTAYLKNVVVCAYPVNMLIVIRDRIQGLQQSRESFYGTIIKIILIWAVPALFSIPTAYMSQPRDTNDADSSGSVIDEENCISVNMFGSFAASATYEILRYFLFYVLVAADILRMARNLRRKMAALKMLNNVPTKETRNNRRTIRLVYFHLVTFAVYWFPAGFFSSYRRLSVRFGNNLNSNFNYRTNNVSFKSVFVGLVIYSYSLLVPLISYLLFEARMSCATSSMRTEQSVEQQGLTTCECSGIVAQFNEDNQQENTGINRSSRTDTQSEVIIHLHEAAIRQQRASNLSTDIPELDIFTPKEWLI